MSRYQETNISSFLLRFVDVSHARAGTDPDYRGVIRHIQSGDEVTFRQWFEVQSFIQRYFPLEELDSSSEEHD